MARKRLLSHLPSKISELYTPLASESGDSPPGLVFVVESSDTGAPKRNRRRTKKKQVSGETFSCNLCMQVVRACDRTRHLQVHLPDHEREWAYCPYYPCVHRVGGHIVTNLYSHIRSTHTNEKLTCAECLQNGRNYTSYYEASMSRHYSQLHPNADRPSWPAPTFPNPLPTEQQRKEQHRMYQELYRDNPRPRKRAKTEPHSVDSSVVPHLHDEPIKNRDSLVHERERSERDISFAENLEPIGALRPSRRDFISEVCRTRYLPLPEETKQRSLAIRINPGLAHGFVLATTSSDPRNSSSHNESQPGFIDDDAWPDSQKASHDSSVCIPYVGPRSISPTHSLEDGGVRSLFERHGDSSSSRGPSPTPPPLSSRCHPPEQSVISDEDTTMQGVHDIEQQEWWSDTADSATLAVCSTVVRFTRPKGPREFQDEYDSSMASPPIDFFRSKFKGVRSWSNSTPNDIEPLVMRKSGERRWVAMSGE